jgi:excisionase family DNA binding protein
LKTLERETAAPAARLMDMAGCAEYLGIKKRTLQDNWRGWGLTAVKVGRAIRFRQSDIDAWLESNKEKGNPWQ